MGKVGAYYVYGPDNENAGVGNRAEVTYPGESQGKSNRSSARVLCRCTKCLGIFDTRTDQVQISVREICRYNLRLR